MIMYSGKNEQGIYTDIFNNELCVKISGVKNPIKIDVMIDDNGYYYGWLDLSDNSISMIYPHELIVKMCFPYGVDHDVKMGIGKIVRLSISECLK